MMKLRVKESFRDKYTGKVYKVDEVIEVEEVRGKEILKSPYAVAVAEEKKTEKNKKQEEQK